MTVGCTSTTATMTQWTRSTPHDQGHPAVNAAMRSRAVGCSIGRAGGAHVWAGRRGPGRARMARGTGLPRLAESTSCSRAWSQRRNRDAFVSATKPATFTHGGGRRGLGRFVRRDPQRNCDVVAISIDVRERQNHVLQSAKEREFVARDLSIVLQDRTDDPARAVLNHRYGRVHPAALPRAYAFDLERRGSKPTALPGVPVARVLRQQQHYVQSLSLTRTTPQFSTSFDLETPCRAVRLIMYVRKSPERFGNAFSRSFSIPQLTVPNEPALLALNEVCLARGAGMLVMRVVSEVTPREASRTLAVGLSRSH
jgi:hypothetical protein